MFNLEIFNRITEKVYISDLETNEIYFINEPLLKLLGIKSLDDVIFRLGGDEFGIFCTSVTEKDDIVSICEKLLEKLNIIIENEQDTVNVTASIGAATAIVDGNNFAKLYQRADSQLYKSKENGKNMYSM